MVNNKTVSIQTDTLTVLIAGILTAQKRGAYTFPEAAKLNDVLETLEKISSEYLNGEKKEEAENQKV